MMPDPVIFPGRQDGRTRFLVIVALVAAAYSSVACGYFMAREWNYFQVAAAEKSRLLRLPGMLARTDREIVREQQELGRIQAEITARLAQK
jgi:hypothetical protein